MIESLKCGREVDRQRCFANAAFLIEDADNFHGLLKCGIDVFHILTCAIFSGEFDNEVCGTFIICTLGRTASRVAPKPDLAFVDSVEALLISVALPAHEFPHPEFFGMLPFPVEFVA